MDSSVLPFGPSGLNCPYFGGTDTEACPYGIEAIFLGCVPGKDSYYSNKDSPTHGRGTCNSSSSVQGDSLLASLLGSLPI